MRNMFAQFAIALSCLVSATVFASGGGNVVGNGGDALVCENGHVVFFDIFEAQKGRGLTIDLGPTNLSFYEKVEYAIHRLPESLREWKGLLRTGVQQFRERSRIDDFDLEDIKDTDNIITMPGCKLKQAVVQRTPILDTDPIFFVDQKIWMKMDNDSRASLVLHEIIYRLAIQAGHQNSVGTRALNSYLMSTTTPQEPTCFYTRALQTLNMRFVIPVLHLGNVELDGTKSFVGSNCMVATAAIRKGTFMVEGVEIAPIPFMSEEFPDEWGADNLDISSPEHAERIQFDSQYRIAIGPHEVLLAASRSAEDWSRTTNWNWAMPINTTPAKRPGYVTMTWTGKVTGAGVENMKTTLMGQTVEIRGDVWFAQDGNRDILRVEFATPGTLVLGGNLVSVDQIEYDRVAKWYLVKLHGKDVTLTVTPDGTIQ